VHATHDAKAVAKAVDAEALSRRELPFWVPLLLIGVLLGTAGVAIASDMARSHFLRGVSAYLRQDFVASRDAFADAAADEPRSADAWANYGTASWTIADTAAAVLGWRQALAIDPGASDLHQRLDAIRAANMTAPGWVPQLPRHAVVWLFAALWIAAWLLAWLAPRAREWHGLHRVALPLGVCALLIGLVAIETEMRISGERLAVVRHTTSLVSDPAIGMDRGPNVGIGEIVRAIGRRGSWTRVEATDDREGWIPSAQLLHLSDRRPAPR
jgi:tetratricopeptide (TPR) repeat protein